MKLFIITFGTTSVLRRARDEDEAFRWLTDGVWPVNAAGRITYRKGREVYGSGRLRGKGVTRDEIVIREATAADAGWVEDAGNARAQKVFAKHFAVDDLAVAA